MVRGFGCSSCLGRSFDLGVNCTFSNTPTSLVDNISIKKSLFYQHFHNDPTLTHIVDFGEVGQMVEMVGGGNQARLTGDRQVPSTPFTLQIVYFTWSPPSRVNGAASAGVLWVR